MPRASLDLAGAMVLGLMGQVGDWERASFQMGESTRYYTTGVWMVTSAVVA